MILDNRDNGRVLDAFKEALADGQKLNIITRRFSLFGYEAIKDALEKVDETELLFSLKAMFPEDEYELPPILGEPEDRKLRNQITPQAIAKSLDDWVSKKVTLKGSHDSLNANHDEVKQKGGKHTTINGSSTMTTPGHEMNTLFDDQDNVSRLHNWYDQIWSNNGSGE